MGKMKKISVRVEGGRGYDILIGYNVLSKIGSEIKPLNVGERVFLITSPKIGKFYLASLENALKQAGYNEISVNYVADGEKNKSYTSYKRLLTQLLSFSEDSEKKVFVINLGGGVVGDLGGFVAATFKRGISYIQVPSTLLAFVDCGIGGKVGIDFEGAKNIVGSFHQPKLVFADLSLLGTLSKRELRSGLAEVVKYGVIHSVELFEFVENNVDKIFSLDHKVVERIVMESYSIKAAIVFQDEFDTKGIRARLNFGHTIGHAVESASKYSYRHGEAVSIGMVCANDIAVKLGLMDKGVAARIENLLIKIGLPIKIKNCVLTEIMNYFWRDKKFVNGKNRFILGTNLGETKIVEDVSVKVIEEVIKNRFAK